MVSYFVYSVLPVSFNNMSKMAQLLQGMVFILCVLCWLLNVNRFFFVYEISNFLSKNLENNNSQFGILGIQMFHKVCLRY